MTTRVFIALPTHDHRIDGGTALACMGAWLAGPHKVSLPHMATSSLLPRNFNTLWAYAVHSGQWTHFAMIHSDVSPLAGWIDILLSECDHKKAGLVSAVIPVCDGTGRVSTAQDRPWMDKFDFQPDHRVMTEKEALELPETFCNRDAASLMGMGKQHGALCANTGLWIADLRQDWTRKVWFEMRSRIEWTPERPHILMEPEDWNFSRQLARLCVKVYCTTKIAVEHSGRGVWSINREKMNMESPECLESFGSRA